MKIKLKNLKKLIREELSQDVEFSSSSDGNSSVPPAMELDWEDTPEIEAGDYIVIPVKQKIVVQQNKKYIAVFDDQEEAIDALHAKMDKEKKWANIWLDNGEGMASIIEKKWVPPKKRREPIEYKLGLPSEEK